MRNEDQSASNEIMSGPYQTMNKKPRSHGRGNKKNKKGERIQLFLVSRSVDHIIVLLASRLFNNSPFFIPLTRPNQL